MPPPFNFSRARNEIAKVAGGEYLLFVDSDTPARTADWAECLLSAPGDQIIAVALVHPGTNPGAAWTRPVVSLDRPRHAYPPYRHRGDLNVGLAKIATGRRLETVRPQRASGLAITGAFLYSPRARFNALNGFAELYRSICKTSTTG